MIWEKFKRLGYWIDGLASWGTLWGLGNSWIVRFTILIPFLGYMILFNEKLQAYMELSTIFVGDIEVEDQKDLFPLTVSSRLYWFYFGFTSLALASIVFLARCPNVVKEHGAAWRFVEREERIVLPGRKDRMIKQIVHRELTTKYGNRFTFRSVMKNEAPDGLDLESTGLFPEASESLRDLDAKLHKASTAEVMTQWFTPLKRARPIARYITFFFYVLGFSVLTVPTLDIFFRVVDTSLR